MASPPGGVPRGAVGSYSPEVGGSAGVAGAAGSPAADAGPGCSVSSLMLDSSWGAWFVGRAPGAGAARQERDGTPPADGRSMLGDAVLRPVSGPRARAR